MQIVATSFIAQLAIHDAVPSNPAPSLRATNRRDQQSMRHVENLIPASLWVKLRPAIAVCAKEGLLARLFTSLNCDCPSERTLLGAAAILAYCCDSVDVTQGVLDAHKEQLKRMIKAQAGSNKHLPYLCVFPDTADGLPNALLQSAYGTDDDTELPVPVTIPELDWLLTDKRIRKERLPTWLKGAPPHIKRMITLGDQSSSGPTIDPAAAVTVPSDYFRRNTASAAASPSMSVQPQRKVQTHSASPAPPAYTLPNHGQLTFWNGFRTVDKTMHDVRNEHARLDRPSVQPPAPLPPQTEFWNKYRACENCGYGSGDAPKVPVAPDDSVPVVVPASPAAHGDTEPADTTEAKGALDTIDKVFYAEIAKWGSTPPPAPRPVVRRRIRMKRSAAPPPPARRPVVRRRPAAAVALTVFEGTDVPSMEDTFAALAAQRGSSTRAQITSRAYDSTVRRCRDHGIDVGMTKKYARHCYKRAATLFDPA